MTYVQGRPTCLPLCSHISKTMGVSWVHTSELHYTSNTEWPTYSCHHTTIIFHTMTQRQSTTMFVASLVTICHNVLTLMCHQLHYTHYMLTCCGNLARHKDCNIRLHLAGAWLPILAWLNPCSCLDTAPQKLWHMGKTALFLYQGCPPTNQTKS